MVGGPTLPSTIFQIQLLASSCLCLKGPFFFFVHACQPLFPPKFSRKPKRQQPLKWWSRIWMMSSTFLSNIWRNSSQNGHFIPKLWFWNISSNFIHKKSWNNFFFRYRKYYSLVVKNLHNATINWMDFVKGFILFIFIDLWHGESC